MPLGNIYVKGSAKWYIYCVIAKNNQKKAIEKHPNLYSNAGKIAQQKHPHLGYELGKKYGKVCGRKRAQTLKGNREYFSKMAKRLQETDPEHSRRNMKKAHETMKKNGTFYIHQRNAALKCMEKNPNQLKQMSKRAHELYPLALLALESRRKNFPYKFRDCFFDSDQERKVCEIFVDKGFIKTPVEGKNIHFRINNYHVDFFIKNKIFIEYHPPLMYGSRKGETKKGYFKKRREILCKGGYKEYPLIVITSIKEVNSKLNTISELLQDT